MKTKAIVLTALLSLVGVLVLFSAMNTRAARASAAVTYRVVGTMKDSTMEKEINEAARDGCKPIIGIGGGDYTETMVILECGDP